MNQDQTPDFNQIIEEHNNKKMKRQPRSQNSWLRILLPALGIVLPVIILAAGVTYGVNRVVTDSNLCASCHEMMPEFYTWQASAHNEVKCTDCHLPDNNQGLVVRYVQGFRQVVYHLAGYYQVSTAIRQPISNDACLKCHSTNRKVSPSGDLIISHELHDSKGAKCINCHAGVAHGQIAERGKVNLIKPEFWTKSLGEQEAVATNTKPKMIQCLECHREWKVSTQCEKCHKKIPTPPSHLPSSWRTLHGQEAWQDVNRCSKCHYDSSLVESFNKELVTQYVRSNKFCYSCHSINKPPGHRDGWAHDHAALVVIGEIPYCIVCHDVDLAKNSIVKGTKTYCNQCHGNFSIAGRKLPALTIDAEGVRESH